MNVSTEITGKINERYNNVENYFQLKKSNEALVKENAQLRQLLKENYEAPDSGRRLIYDTIKVDSGKSILKYNILEAKVVNSTISLQANYLTIHRGFAQQVRIHDPAVLFTRPPAHRLDLVFDVSEFT